jgi:hypothetical protein
MMNKVNKIYDDLILSTIKPFEDYSDKIIKTENQIKYADGHNNCIISEDSLSRTLSIMKDKDFAILTAYRSNFSKVENIVRNRKLRAILNNHKMGVHQLVGHWQEAPAGMDYEQAKKDGLLTDSVERFYLVAKPDSMTTSDFINLAIELMTIDGETQDGVVFHCADVTGKEGYYILNNDGSFFKIGDKLTLGKISQAYSRHVKKSNIPFVFEGLEVPVSNSGKLAFKKLNILYV